MHTAQPIPRYTTPQIGVSHMSRLRQPLRLSGHPFFRGYTSKVTLTPNDPGISIEGKSFGKYDISGIRNKRFSTLQASDGNRSFLLIEHIFSAIAALGIIGVDIYFEPAKEQRGLSQKLFDTWFFEDIGGDHTIAPMGNGSMGWFYDRLKDNLVLDNKFEYIHPSCLTEFKSCTHGLEWKKSKHEDMCHLLTIEVTDPQLRGGKMVISDVYEFINHKKGESYRYARAMNKTPPLIKNILEWRTGYKLTEVVTSEDGFRQGEHWLASDLLAEIFLIFGAARLTGKLTFNGFGSHQSRLLGLRELRDAIEKTGS